MADVPEDEEDEDIKVLMRMHPIQPVFASKEKKHGKNKSLAMQKLDANEKFSPHIYEDEETLYSVPLKAEKDLIKSPKGLKFQSSGSKEVKAILSASSSPSKPFGIKPTKVHKDSIPKMIQKIGSF